ncbi:phage shock protein C (PspC) family protein [Allonocardiopsis opalescens]|uniref:Phage shock protein C (PspC) family protein n=2 Tax=Allonocardiopsis opalescens TaxID=1144618 RepID=A0A2T0Q8H3_9ACTN|nr:phage shock protein C (PspC) family protein [Allonocardiopsis opalescens]
MAGERGRRLRRFDGRAVLTGTCAGIGRYTGIDPLLIRVAFALLGLAIGAGVVLYVAAWLMLPGDRGGPAPAEQVLRRRLDDDVVMMLLGVGMVVFGLLSMAPVGWSTLLIATVLTLAVLVARSRGVDLVQRLRGLPRRLRAASPAPAPPPPATTPKPSYYDPAQRQTVSAQGGPIDLGAFEPGATVPGATAPGYAPGATVPDIPRKAAADDEWEDVHSAVPPYAPPRLPRPVRTARVARRERGAPLGMVAFSLVLIEAAVGAVLAASVAPPAGLPWFTVTVGGMVMTIGALAVVATWVGNGRGLIPLGAMASLVLLFGSMDPSIAWLSDVTWRPRSAAEVQPVYTLQAGAGELDLSALPLEPEQRVAVGADVDFGLLEVLVPQGADVEVRTALSYGAASIGGDDHVGADLDVRRTLAAEPADDAAPVIVLDLHSTVGVVEVSRVAPSP